MVCRNSILVGTASRLPQRDRIRSRQPNDLSGYYSCLQLEENVCVIARNRLCIAKPGRGEEGRKERTERNEAKVFGSMLTAAHSKD